MVYSGTRHPEAAVRFLLFITGLDAQELLMHQANLQPARLSLGGDYARYTRGARQGINMDLFIEQTRYARPAPFFANQSRVSSVLVNTLNQAIYHNAMPAASAMESLQREISALIQEEVR